jgi:hypothetical protein
MSARKRPPKFHVDAAEDGVEFETPTPPKVFGQCGKAVAKFGLLFDRVGHETGRYH